MKLQRAFPLLLLAAITAEAKACATCAGGDNLQLIEASNTVLWALLGLVGFIFVATGATVLFLWRKANAVPSPAIQTLNPAAAAD